MVANFLSRNSLFRMIAIETLREEAARLPLKERAAFAAYVLQTLPPPDYGVSDEVVAKRLEALKSGAVQGLTTEQLFSAVTRLVD